MEIKFEPLDDHHDRAAFTCGVPSIDEFFHRSASQRMRRRIGTPIVIVQPAIDPRQILGFSFLIPHEFRGEELPDPIRKRTRVGRLNAVPGAFLAQLGVALEFQGQGLGKELLKDALRRSLILAREWGCVAVVTDPIDERAFAMYAAFGFQVLESANRRLILLIQTVADAISRTSL